MTIHNERRLSTTISIISTLIAITVSFSWWCASLDNRVGVNAVDIRKVEVMTNTNKEHIQALIISNAKYEEKFNYIKESLNKIERLIEADKQKEASSR